MPNLIDVRGEGPVSMPDDLLGPLGFMSGALYKVLPSDWNWAAYTAAFNAIADARDSLRAQRHQQNMEFQRLLEAESVRQRNVRIEAELQPEPIPGHECVSDCRRFGCEDVAGRPDPDVLYDAWRDRENQAVGD